MTDLMVLDLGGVALPFDEMQAAELTKNMTAGFGGSFKKSARLSMGNSGDWELVDSEGEIHDLGREVNIVIVDQREFVSRIHYEKSFDEVKASGEFLPADCQSYNGIEPDENVKYKYADKCKGCTAFEQSGQSCGYYRRVVAVLAHEDGTFSDPFIFEPKAKSLFDKTVVKERYGSFGWYMTVLASNKRNGVALPIPTQSVVTKCMSMPKMDVATIKFGLGSTSSGGYWTLNKEQFAEILALKDSDEVKDMLKPFNAAFNNPSSAGRIPVKDVTDSSDDVTELEPMPVGKNSQAEATVVEEAKPAPKRKSPPAKKTAKPATQKVVLGLEHPDVKNSEDYDYAELVEWAKDADENEVREFLEAEFPKALEPVEVEVPTQPAEEAKPAPKHKSPPAKKVAEDKNPSEAVNSNVVDTTGQEVGPELAKKAEQLAEGLDEFDD